MKIIVLNKNNIKIKEAASFDDQPNFHTPRYKRKQNEILFSDDGLNQNEDDIKKKWKKKRLKRPSEIKKEWPDISMG